MCMKWKMMRESEETLPHAEEHEVKDDDRGGGGAVGSK